MLVSKLTGAECPTPHHSNWGRAHYGAMVRLAPMKLLAVAAVVALLLTGCASAPKAEPKAKPSPVNVNLAACGDFAATFTRLKEAGDARSAGTSTIEQWHSVVDKAATDYSAISVKAKGDVKTRIDDLVEFIDARPTGIRGLGVFDSPENDMYLSKLERVGQACTAEGFEMSFESK